MRFQVTRGAKPRAQKVVLAGVEGIGKTTFASQAPSPLFLDVDGGGSDSFDVPRLPPPASWAELLAMVADVAAGGVDDGFATLVVDTADGAEQMMIDYICQRDRKETLSDYGWGKGPVVAGNEWRKLLDGLEAVIASGMNVIVTAHTAITRIEQPDEIGVYDHYALKLSKYVSALTREWCDALIFASFKIYVSADERGRAKATGGKKRVMHMSHSASWDAKCRWPNVPDELPLDFAQIQQFLPIPVTPREKLLDRMQQDGITVSQMEGVVNSRIPNAGQWSSWNSELVRYLIDNYSSVHAAIQTQDVADATETESED